jgi:hypothetical protein
VRLRPLVPTTLAFALVVAACGGGQDGQLDGGATDDDVGSTTQAQADVAMDGLCDIAAGILTEMADVHEAFHGRAHEILHHVATEVQAIDPRIAGDLLEAKSVVEADLEEATPVPELPAHAGALAEAFADALQTLGLRAPPCPPA